ncbi:hypothetical protein lerEdw1_002944, partial [Lerista edwardsae]
CLGYKAIAQPTLLPVSDPWSAVRLAPELTQNAERSTCLSMGWKILCVVTLLAFAVLATSQETDDGSILPASNPKGSTMPKTTDVGGSTMPKTTDVEGSTTPKTTDVGDSTTPKTTDMGGSPTPKTTDVGGSPTPKTTDVGGSPTPKTTDYDEIYACAGCPYEKSYENYTLMALRPGSVEAYTQLNFQNNSDTSAKDFGDNVVTQLRTADAAKRQGFILNNVNGTFIQVEFPPVPPRTSPPESVPGWGIALLVLVCILVLFALIAILILLIRWCRRSHRGHIDIMSSRDSYHPMNEYPPYQTHGRYVAPPSNKQNPYSETNNGTSPFSYTNPAMANENL